MDQARWNAAVAHRDRLLKLALARGMSAEDAKDVVQEALLRCAEFEPLDLDRIGQFLTTVTVRLCADVHRRYEEPVRARRWLAPLLHDEPDPADLVCRDHGPEWVASLVERLPERQRRVLFDRAHGMSIQQIASRHKLTYKAAESALARARAAMRSAVTTSLSLVMLLARRGRPRTAVVTASAVALVVTAIVTLPHHDRLPASPLPPAGQDRAIAGSGRAPAPARALSPRPHALPAVHVTPAPSPAAGAGVRRAQRTRPPGPLPTFSVSQGPLLIERHDDGYTPAERLDHCIRYGIALYPTVQCRYPTQEETS